MSQIDLQIGYKIKSKRNSHKEYNRIESNGKWIQKVEETNIEVKRKK